MSKKILISLSVIGIVAAIAIGGTIAYFNDTETSTGNIFVAGSIDLKVDHLKQTYNGADCKTCSVTVISDDTNNMVVEKFESSITPYPAVYVGSNGGFIHSAWTAQNDSVLAAAGAEWIWESDPTRVADLTNDVTYTFENNFEWWGPIVDTDLYMAVGSDNSVWVYLNGTLIGSNTGEFGYLQGSMLQIPAGNITPYILQGNNVLRFVVKNWALQDSTIYTNPAGLVYKFSIDGNCGDDYFKTYCMLWGEKDLDNETFYNFDDIKPGDYGLNLISLHAYSNDAYACLITHHVDDQENDLVDPEVEANDPGMPDGELSQFIKIFAWEDKNYNGVYEPSTEGLLLVENTPLATGIVSIPLIASNTRYIGIAWCAGTQSVDGAGVISCDGASMGDIAQTDSFTASVTAYAEQQRNNTEFDCEDVDLEEE